MYSDIYTDPLTTIPAGTIHTSQALDLIGFLHTGIFIIANSVPNNSDIILQGCGTENEPLNTQWHDLYETKFYASEPYLIEKTAGFTWIRYKIICGPGSDITGFVGHVFRKGW